MGRYWLLILALYLGVAPGRGMAQVTMDARLGLQGIVRLEKWNLVTVHLHNAGSAVTGTLGVRVQRGSELRGDLHVATFTQPVELPPQAKKRLTFSIPLASVSYPVEVFLQAAEAVLAQQRLDLRDTLHAEQVILGLTPDLRLDFLATTLQTHTRVVYLPTTDLPQHWSGYDVVSAVVMKGLSLQTLSESQVTALRQWIARGGTLIVAGDSQYALLQEPRLRALLPVQVLGLQELTGLPALAERYGVPLPEVPLVAVRARLHQGQALIGTAEAPVLAQRAFGMGRVVFLAVDYAIRPLDGWPGTAALWKDMLKPPEAVDVGRVFAELGLLDDTHPIMKLLGRPILTYPSHAALGLFLLAYCGSLGLVFWRLGKRLRPSRSSWVVGLVLVCGFTWVAYRLFAERGLRQPALVFDVTTMEVLPDTDYVHLQGYVGVFSAPGGQFTLPLQHPETILRHTFLRGVSKAESALEMRANGTHVIRNITLEPWTLRVLTVESMAAAPLHVTARRHAAGLTIQVKNRAAVPLQGALVLYQGKVFALGTVAPGKEVFDDLYTAIQAPDGAQEVAWRVLLKQRPAAPEARLGYVQEVLLQHYFGDKRLLDVSEAPLLIGWLTGPMTLTPATETGPVWGMTFVFSRLTL